MILNKKKRKLNPILKKFQRQIQLQKKLEITLKMKKLALESQKEVKL